MDYEEFMNNYKKEKEWDRSRFKLNSEYLDDRKRTESAGVVDINDYYAKSDAVNSPAHYTRGSQEAIDIIEEAIQDAPSVKAGMLQAQVLKYLLRLWLKENSRQDAEKARWYLNRLIDSL